jgi:hypothetical protein
MSFRRDRRTFSERRNLAPTRSALVIVQETGDPRLQQGGVVRFTRGRVREEPALDVSRQIIPFADKGGTHNGTWVPPPLANIAHYSK